MKEMQKEMNDMSPEDKKMMDSMGIKMPSIKDIPKATDKQLADAYENENRIVPKRDPNGQNSSCLLKGTNEHTPFYMKKIFLLSLLCAFVTVANAQKKLTPITQSALTGIGLPNGSKQDSRILSVAAAATLLEMESDKTGTKVQNTEVLILPPASLNRFNKDSLVKRLVIRNWKIIATESANYLWAQKDKRFVIVYFLMNPKESSLYFAEASSTPNFNTQVENTTGKPPAATPVIQQPIQPVQNTNKAIESIDGKQQSNTNTPITTSGSLINYVWKSHQNRKDAMGNYAGYSTNSYQFYSNGTYKFSTTTFQNYAPKYYMVYEDGTYQIDGSKITLKPVTSKFEVRQKEKTDPVLKSGNLVLESVQYSFEYTTIYDRQRLILAPTTSSETKRDGEFNFYSGGAMTKSYLYDAEEKPVTQINNNQNTQLPTLSSGSYSFSTTNFDDGWVSTVQEDWIQVTKGNIKVLIHYPNKNADAYNSVLMDGLKNAWNILVAPKYSSASNFEFKPISSWQSIEFAEGDAVEKTTGTSVHIVLFKMNYSNGSGKYLEFITPDKKTFEQEFGPYHETSYGWEKVEGMANYNKFAVAATDLTGKWTNNFSGTQQYANAYTGASAGMDTHSSNQNFEFGPQNTYKWDLSVASGFVGNIKFQNVKSSGQFSMPNNWQINFSDLEGKPKTYNAFFSCIKGFRILMLEDAGYPTGYTGYGKVE